MARGFTMIEILAVLVILALSAGVVAVNVRAPLREAALAEVVQQVADFDARTRTIARRRGWQLRLQVDLSDGRLSRNDADTGGELGEPAALPRGWRFEELRLIDDRITAGAAAVGVSEHGLSRSYALLVTGPEGRRLWLLCAGLTGEFSQYESDEEVEEILSQTKRDHAG